MLKIFTQPPGAGEEAYIFNFTSSSTAARAEADAIKDALSNSIQAARADTAVPVATGAGASSAAMAIASAISSGAGSRSWEDNDRLVGDVQLHASLMEQNAGLKTMFRESLRTKPESISVKQFTQQFWSTRVNLLRAHALEKSQSRGSYNVLATMEKAKKEGGSADGPKMTLSREQVQLIFQQYPLVKRAYDENVPKPLNEIDFWSKFFQSRLLKKLRGEKVVETDLLDKVLDKYLNAVDEMDDAREVVNANVPHIIDVEKNEENHSQRKGNQPDFTMRPNSKVPIIRTLNALSEKIMAQVAPIDGDPSQPIGMDEETFNELQLRDLQGDPEQHRIILNIREQSRFFNDQKADNAAAVENISKQNPKKVMRKLRSDLASLNVDGRGVDLAKKIGWEDDVDSDDEQDHAETVGSKTSLAKASAQIVEAIRQRRSQTQELSSLEPSHSETDTSGLSTAVFDRLALTHATTTEFLHQFWLAFLSGDPDRVNEIASLVESLNRALDRIKAVADDAEADLKKAKEDAIATAKRQYERTQRRPKEGFLDAIPGGAKVVNQMMAPTARAVGVAIAEYQKAMKRETAALQSVS
jgi:transcription initiation factor TFIIH subunit 1